jgi:DNA repair protein RecN (Recombination protein N)
MAAARTLAAARRGVAGRFARDLERMLGELALERARFETRFAAAPAEGTAPPEADWTAEGIDVGEFFVSLNAGEDVRPLARIVSGGELSRIMLAMKTLTRLTRTERPAAPPGLIFDEVDAGIGGRVADVVGGRLHALASSFQVLCITHLPQIAAYADTHFQIVKRVKDGRTTTIVRKLDDGGRVDELARMLGGSSISEGLRASAREMLAGKRREHDLRKRSEPHRGLKGSKGHRRGSIQDE